MLTVVSPVVLVSDETPTVLQSPALDVTGAVCVGRGKQRSASAPSRLPFLVNDFERDHERMAQIRRKSLEDEDMDKRRLEIRRKSEPLEPVRFVSSRRDKECEDDDERVP